MQRWVLRPAVPGDEFRYHEHVTDWLRRPVHPAIAAILAHDDATNWNHARRVARTTPDNTRRTS